MTGSIHDYWPPNRDSIQGTEKYDHYHSHG